MPTKQKQLGAYYTPDEVVNSLVRWAVRDENDRLLDPSCGDGRFLAAHANSVGVEHDADAVAAVLERSPFTQLHNGDFFDWASATSERFECAAGNPPFIRYQRFNGQIRATALTHCRWHGAIFSALTSSWAPFLVAAATLLKRGGRMAFVVPAEIGHAPYARPVLDYMARHFDTVHIIAVRKKLFPELSEDCWLLYCDGFGGRTTTIRFTALDSFRPSARPPSKFERIELSDWKAWDGRLRPFLLDSSVRSLYREFTDSPETYRFQDVAKVGIGYVTGANDFFHLRPSDAERFGIPKRFLRPAVRNGKSLSGTEVTPDTVQSWLRRDDPVLLLNLNRNDDLPKAVRSYLDTPAGIDARNTYKCRNRSPWYVVPDVSAPDAFLSYMSGLGPSLVANEADCVGTNSVHAVTLTADVDIRELQSMWQNPITHLSCELEGHPLGGGMLKLEPREAGRIILSPVRPKCSSDTELIETGIQTMREWRHYG
jgi:adenine-specific DNA methylase